MIQQLSRLAIVPILLATTALSAAPRAPDSAPKPASAATQGRHFGH